MLELERAVLGHIESAVADENRRWGSDKMSFDLSQSATVGPA